MWRSYSTKRFVIAVMLGASMAPASAALAHPFGQKPVALIRAEKSDVQVVWVMAPDDLEAMAQHVQFTEELESELVRNDRFTDYFQQHVAVSNQGSDCPDSIQSVTRVASGWGVHLSYKCPESLGAVVIRISLLQDLSPDYITLAQARTPWGIKRGVFRAGSDTLTFDFGPGPKPSTSLAVGPSGEGRLNRIIGSLESEGSVSFAAALALAFLMGALHAFTPGHGKTIAAAYLVSDRGTVGQALALSGVVTLTHSVSVIILGGLAIALDQILLPNQWGPWLEIAAGILIIVMGMSLLRSRSWGHHHHSHLATDEHGHEHLKGIPVGRLAMIGLVGGLVPSPEAIGITLVAFSAGKWATGSLIVVAFSLGLAVVMLGVGLAAVRGGKIIRRLISGPKVEMIPRIAAVVFLLMGAVVIARAVSNF